MSAGFVVKGGCPVRWIQAIEPVVSASHDYGDGFDIDAENAKQGALPESEGAASGGHLWKWDALHETSGERDRERPA